HPRRFDAGATTLALANIGLGLFYKVAISDVLGIYVNAVYDNLHAYSGLTLSAATLGFSAQLFFDFAGYSLLALGTAGLLGIRVTRNFNAPYFSRSLKEFWSRWHISLSSWLRDYIYIPLGGNRQGKLHKYRNLVLTFVISGIWHGAGLSFILWGLLHGVLQVLGELLQPARSACLSKLHLSRRSRFVLLMQWLSTAFMVNELWIFFRADTISDALYLLQHQFFNLSLSTFYNETLAVLSSAFNPLRLLCLAYLVYLAAALLLGVLLDAATRFKTHDGDVARWLCALPFLKRWFLYYGMAGFIFAGYLLNNGYFAGAVSFIYNNF
ncbi:MAG: MBOAT family O-acyltransferase, partial [Pygmaiobacter sp.]